MQEHRPAPKHSSSTAVESPHRLWRIGLLVLLALAAVVLFVFVTIQNRIRTRQSLEAWQDLRAELEAKGESLDREDFIPPAVPDELNLYKAPGMQARFSRLRSQTNRVPVISLPAWVSEIPLTLDQLRDMPETVDEESAASTSTASRQRLREWFAQQEAEYRLLVEASARPHVRFDADFTNLTGNLRNGMDIPDYVNLRNVALALAARANLSFVDSQPDDAVQSLFIIRRLADLSSSPPSFIGAMLRVAIMGLYVDSAGEALNARLLPASNMASIQEQVRDVDLLADITRAWRAERSLRVHWLTLEPEEALNSFQSLLTPPAKPLWRYSLDDWKERYNILQFKREINSRRRMIESLILICRLQQQALDQVDVTNGRIHATAIDQVFSNTMHTVHRAFYEQFLAAYLLPHYSRATTTTAQRQTELNQLYVACALERFRLTHGNYPETLSALLPEFLDHIPTDLFADQPLQYRLNPDGSYDLWSVGWDEKDDGGKPNLDVTGKPLYNEKQGDWVWSSPKR